MINATRERLIRELRADAVLFALVKGRIYPSDLATLKDPKYPCVTAGFGGGTPLEGFDDIGDILCTLQTFSSKSYSEAWDVYEKVKDTIAQEVYSDSDVTIRLTLDSIPFERYLLDDRVYSIVSRWNVFMLGA